MNNNFTSNDSKDTCKYSNDYIYIYIVDKYALMTIYTYESDEQHRNGSIKYM